MHQRRAGVGPRRARGLFLPYQAEQIEALKSLIATWMRLAIFQTMSLGEDDHRLWFVVDELDALGHIDGLERRPRSDQKIRRALRARLPVDRLGEHDLRSGAGEDNRRELLELAHPAMLIERRRRDGAVRECAHR